ncbi:MAG TPA: amidohydrolase family protein [Acidimicrobiia bacterium]|nr:amidohydrolase family protein [Acidimicrobiia bacterium]
MLDCLVTGGEVLDGSGRPGRRADVAIRDGRVVAIAAPGTIDEDAAARIDADGLAVAPGFVDIHTHYDAQLFWDPAATPSPLHGVTTIVGGNCGFTIAPLVPSEADYMRRMLARVEGMPLESLEAGVPWDWRSFGDYLDRLDGNVAVNAGFLVGHSAIRRAVMRDAAVGEEAKPAQVDEMARLLDESLAAGGLGFSSSQAATHNGGDGRPVPSRFATRDELLALCGVVRRHDGTTLEFIPAVGGFLPEHLELMTTMSLAANRPLNWNVLAVNSARPQAHEESLAAGDYAAERGGRVLALTVPDVTLVHLNFKTAFLLDALPGWGETMALPHDEKLKALSDPEVRARLKESAASPDAGVFRTMFKWENMRIVDTFAPENAGLAGSTVGKVAAERGVDPFDALLDVVIADDLRTVIAPPMAGGDDASWRMRAEVWRDPRAVVGASDAGAHLDMLSTFTYTTSMLRAVREHDLMPMAEAVHLLTDVQARLYGIRERGRIQEGWHADLVVFDADRIAPGRVYTRDDLPGGAGRLYAEAEGIEHVLVNGVEIVRGGEVTGATPGTLLRSGRDTETVTVPGGQSG